MESPSTVSPLSKTLSSVEPRERGRLLMQVASFLPDESGAGCRAGHLRAQFAQLWELLRGEPVPIRELRAILQPPVPVRHVVVFCELGFMSNCEEIHRALIRILGHLAAAAEQARKPAQPTLFCTNQCNANDDESRTDESSADGRAVDRGGITDSLHYLIARGAKFRCIYADPPWQYCNTSSRGAASNHYPTLSVEDICNEPVEELVEDSAHLHLWTTNGFLRESFDVLEAWGFTFKSCLVWTKTQLGMGNYWRVSHEFLMLGVRGSLPFLEKTHRSWFQADRTIHSRKPSFAREMVERVSPGPYLEMYGRFELPESTWTVYGNQVERRLF